MEMMIISVSAVLAGAVCGDHVSPISDTTVMSSAGAQCNHMNHVSTQLPYAAVVACCGLYSGGIYPDLVDRASVECGNPAGSAYRDACMASEESVTLTSRRNAILCL